MAVARDVSPGTPVITADHQRGTVLRSYPGTSVVTVQVKGAIMSMMRHELQYADHHDVEFPTLTWEGGA
jgi:hypothetical protein